MKEESRDLYRIDPLKVRRKIFESYPKGSRQREDMIKEEKLNELGQLNNIVSSMPLDATNIAIEDMQNRSLLLMLKSLFFTFVALTLGFFVVAFSLSAVELFLSIVGTIVFSYLSVRSLLHIYINYKLIKNFSESLSRMETKISKLKKDIFDDPIK